MRSAAADHPGHRIEFLIVDSIAVACGGAPESAELANRFMLALRRLRVGSLLIAHVNRSETGDQKPFGSAFWANNARSTWFIQRSDEASDERRVTATMFHRKVNIGGKRHPIGYEIAFDAGRAFVNRVDPTTVPGAPSGYRWRNASDRLSKAVTGPSPSLPKNLRRTPRRSEPQQNERAVVSPI